jgi:AraC family transcriptional regulator of adaptative response/methylated-DNA-[protein]-cysteine methyltransferase
MTVAIEHNVSPVPNDVRSDRQSMSSQRPSDYHRVAEAIRYLERHADRQPGLDELANVVGLSPHHFQRLFKRWAGVSPKRFLQYLTVEHAKHLLRDASSVLDTSYEVGLSGPGRLHDLFVSAEAVTPGEYKRQGEGVEIVWGIHQTPFGDCLLAATDRGVCHLSFPSGSSAGIERLRHDWSKAGLAEDAEVSGRFVERLFGDSSASDKPLPLVLKGTNFQLKVWNALLRIPRGQAVSYGDVAAYIGHPEAVRAVGSAVGANPVAWLIPCHRVLRKGGALGGYRWGPVRKQAMLAWEAAQSEDRTADIA